MTYQIFKSVVDGFLLGYRVDYAAAVEAHRQALLAHRFTGDAAPTAPALIENAVRRVHRDGEADDFVSDFEIVDDTPPEPVVTDADRKAALVAKVRMAEREACDAVIPPGKLRLLNLEAGLVFSKPDDQRSAAENATLASYRAVQDRIAAINLHGARLEAELDDLTPEQYGTWTQAPFPTA